MIRHPHRLSPRRAGWAALAIALVALPAAANAQGLFSMFRGGEPSSYEIERQLEASGYIVTGPLLMRGDVYLADVVVRGEGPERLVIDPESGRIMQRFRMRGEGWREAAAPPPNGWDQDPRQWNGPRPPADIGPGVPPPQDDWVPQGPALAPAAPAAIETPKSAPKKVETKPKPTPTPVANVANPPAIRSTPAPVSSAPPKPAPTLAQPTPAASAKPTPAASAAPTPSPSASQQAAKVDAPAAAPVVAPAPSAPTPAPSAKGKPVNDIPVTPLD
ncbi:MAG: hypothetical protein E7774_14465 [Bradyrhizobium sp.]|nr:MAG: hypothetical protein E7774_14465 [Bradyrhizobium sp.]